ncbi:hypothetical protein GCM10010390_77840 [Streptomyces mordarskii]|uniref:Uncharacterized protein n=1 Tax=Streptomyces mordarskii TaxID=1226758 RepID=A0ABN1ECZ3_9ACTN
MPGCPGAGAVTAAPPNQWRGISPCGSFSQLIRGRRWTGGATTRRWLTGWSPDSGEARPRALPGPAVDTDDRSGAGPV